MFGSTLQREEPRFPHRQKDVARGESRGGCVARYVSFLRSSIADPLRRESGQALMFAALLAPILLGMTGMAIDIGTYAGHKRHLQNAADSVALAAAQQMCLTTCADTSAARTAANQWASKNNVNASDMTLTFSGGSTAPKASVTINSNHNFAFMRIFGVNNKNVAASAAAIKASYGGGAGIVPWSVTGATLNGAISGSLVTMKYDANNVSTGNFNPIRIDGSGAATYGSSVQYGAQDIACAATTANCTTSACATGTFPACAENSPTCTGPDCTPQTGNVVGPTRTAVDFRMNNTTAECNTFGGGAPGTTGAFWLLAGQYLLNPNCNPWSGPGQCVGTNPGLCSRRVIIVPIINGFGSGASTPVTIQKFALIYLEGYTGTCTGNSCEITGEYVQAKVSANALAGLFDPTASIQFTKLTE
jgi:Flp pilus assembly protein TadG